MVNHCNHITYFLTSYNIYQNTYTSQAFFLIILFLKFRGVLLVWGGFLYTPIDSQKHKVFFILPNSSRRKSLLWYSDRLSLVPPTTGLDVTLQPFWKAVVQSFSYWTPLPVSLNFKKHYYHISDNYNIYKELCENAKFFFYFF